MSADNTLSVARGRKDHLGAIAEAESHTLPEIADLFRQSLAVPVPYTFDMLSEARAVLKAAKAERDAGKLRGANPEEQKRLSEAVRAAAARIDRMKRTPWITFATFEGSRRNREAIKTCTAFVGDADQGAKLQPLLDRLNALGCSYIVHTSTSHGCEGQERYRVIIPLATPLAHPIQQYPALWASMCKQLGGVLDPNASDPTRLNYMPRTPTGATEHQVICVDDRPWLDAASIVATAPETSAASVSGEALRTITAEQETDLRAALLHPQLLAAMADNSFWSNDIGYALLSLSDKGRELWLWISEQAPGYDPGAPEQWWAEHGHYTPQLDFRHIYKKARELGWPNPRLSSTCAISDFLPKVETPSDAVVNLQRTVNGTPLSNVNNAFLVLSQQTGLTLAYDEFLFKLMVRWPEDPTPRPLTDEDITRVRIHLQRMGMQHMSAEGTYAAMQLVAKSNTVNCVADWLAGLKWDGKRRLSLLMPRAFGTSAARYHIRAGRNMLIAMVARALEPGCQMDEAVVLEGPQGSLKSSALRTIGGDYFAELTASPNSRDFEQQLQGVWLGEFAELNALRRTEDIARVKQFVTNRVDHFRMPYGRVVSDFPRRIVLCGSTNEECWLHDPSGGRRFIPVEIGRIDLDWLQQNREQLFAEAVSLYNAGRKWWIFPKAETIARQEARSPDDPWTSKIRAYLQGRSMVTVAAILEYVIRMPTDRQTKAHQTRVGVALRQLGCKKLPRRRVGAGRSSPWIVPAEFVTLPVIHDGPVMFAPVPDGPPANDDSASPGNAAAGNGDLL